MLKELVKVSEGLFVNAMGLYCNELGNVLDNQNMNNEGAVNMTNTVVVDGKAYSVNDKVADANGEEAVIVNIIQDVNCDPVVELCPVVTCDNYIISADVLPSYTTVNNNKLEGVVNMSKNKYTVEVINNEPVVIVNKSGKSYTADKGATFVQFIADKEQVDNSLLKARQMFKEIFPNKGDYSKYAANPKPMFTADNVKVNAPVNTTQPTKLNTELPRTNGAELKGKVIYVLREALPIVRKNQAGRFCLPSQAKLTELNIKFKCSCCNMDVKVAVPEYLMNNQDKISKEYKGKVVCQQCQIRITNGEKPYTKQERQDIRRQAYLKTVYAKRDKMVANGDIVITDENQGF